jgi:hypothetical protein
MILKPDSNGFYRNFYYLRTTDVRGALLFITQDVVGDIMKGTEPTKTPVPFVYYKGSREKGFLVGGIAIYLVHDSVINVFKENNFTGWDTFPIEAYDKTNKKLEGYQGLFISGRCGKLIDSLSSIEDRPNPNGRIRPIKVGLFFEPETWDGSDFFSPDASICIFVTKRVKEVLEKQKINTIAFENITENTRIFTIKN